MDRDTRELSSLGLSEVWTWTRKARIWKNGSWLYVAGEGGRFILYHNNLQGKRIILAGGREVIRRLDEQTIGRLSLAGKTKWRKVALCSGYGKAEKETSTLAFYYHL